MLDSQDNSNQIKELNKIFCQYIFKPDSLTKSESDNLTNVVNSAIKLKEWHVPYEIITEKIYATNMENLEEIPNSVQEKLVNIRAIDNQDISRINKVRDDTVRHVHLAIVQKKYIDSNLKQAKEELEQIKDIKDSIYSDFIAILGIFTAITFATFGGLQLIGNIFGKLNRFSFKNIGGVLMLGSIYLLGMYLILIALLIGISKLNNRKYYLSNNSIYVLTTSFITIFTFGFGLVDKIFSTHVLFWMLIAFILIMWIIVIRKILKKSA